MKLTSFEVPKSSFLSIQKDTQTIFQYMLKNKRFQKLLFYTTTNPLVENDLTDKEKAGLLGTNIKIVPKFIIDGSVKNYVIVTFDNFSKNYTNPEFRDNTIIFDIVCHYDQWQLQDFKLRPFLIAAEIDTMFNDTHLSGIGTLEFLSAEIHPINEEYCALGVAYTAIHGDEDKKNMINPAEQAAYNKEFNELFNQ